VGAPVSAEQPPPASSTDEHQRQRGQRVAPIRNERLGTVEQPQKKKRGFWSRLFGGGGDDKDKKKKEEKPPRDRMGVDLVIMVIW
jgi:hypothetical protein